MSSVENNTCSEARISGTIKNHEGKKYLRPINCLSVSGVVADVDVYQVLEVFQVTCPATAHAVKKLLCCGNRGKGNRLDDLKGALAAVMRAIELEEQRGGNSEPKG